MAVCLSIAGGAFLPLSAEVVNQPKQEFVIDNPVVVDGHQNCSCHSCISLSEIVENERKGKLIFVFGGSPRVEFNYPVSQFKRFAPNHYFSDIQSSDKDQDINSAHLKNTYLYWYDVGWNV